MLASLYGDQPAYVVPPMMYEVTPLDRCFSAAVARIKQIGKRRTTVSSSRGREGHNNGDDGGEHAETEVGNEEPVAEESSETRRLLLIYLLRS